MGISLSKIVATLKPRRRWFQYSLRTLLLLVTALAVWLGFYVHRANKQREAVAAIQRLGGWLRYDYQIVGGKFDPKAESPIPVWLLKALGEVFFHDVVEVNLVYNDDGPRRLENANLSDESLYHLPNLPGVRALLLRDAQATDEGLECVGQLKRLERLLVWDASEVSDFGIRYLRDLKNLRDLHISNSGITDDALRVIGTLYRLEHLSLQGNRFTDRGLKHLRKLSRLKSLSIGAGKTRVTDDGLVHLHALKNLKTLELYGSPITHEGLAKLRSALASIQVFHELTDTPRAIVKEQIPAPTTPQLRFLSWGHRPPENREDPIQGAYWHRSGTPATDPSELDPLRRLRGFAGDGQRDKCLYLFISHPGFSADAFGQIDLLDASGQPLDNAMHPIRASTAGAIPNKRPGWQLFEVEARPGVLPDSGTLRLRYTAGEWKEIAILPVDSEMGDGVGQGVSLVAIGETANGVSFVTLMIDQAAGAEFQYGLRAKDGTDRPIRRDGLVALDRRNSAKVYTFTFRCPLESIAAFDLLCRKKEETVFHDVSLRPGYTAPAEQPGIDENQ